MGGCVCVCGLMYSMYVLCMLPRVFMVTVLVSVASMVSMSVRGAYESPWYPWVSMVPMSVHGTCDLLGA